MSMVLRMQWRIDGSALRLSNGTLMKPCTYRRCKVIHCLRIENTYNNMITVALLTFFNSGMAGSVNEFHHLTYNCRWCPLTTFGRRLKHGMVALGRHALFRGDLTYN